MFLQCLVGILGGVSSLRSSNFVTARLLARRYAIPGVGGTLKAGKRFFNYVWYDNCAADSADLEDNLTDIEGHKHRNTLPMGKMRPEIWEKQITYATECMTPCFLELVSKTSMPFVPTIRDCSSTRASFFDGRLLFVGEALTLVRPHTGMSFNHSAVNCMTLRKVLQGHLTVREWEREVLQWAEWNSGLAVAVGSYYQCHVSRPTFLLSVIRFILALLRQRLMKILHPFRARL